MRIIKYNLDFNIYYAKDRCNSIRNLNLSELSPTDLETIGNYILYGKDSDNTSVVDRKEVQIKTKYSSFNKREPISLNALMESPTFNENIIQTGKNIYKKTKPSINKEKAKSIPGMKELWSIIQEYQRILDENVGKEEKQDSTPTLSQKEIYFLRHQLIELRTHQYYLYDSQYPVISLMPNKGQYFTDITTTQLQYRVFPRGTMRVQNDKDFRFPRQDKKKVKVRDIDREINRLAAQHKFFIDFRNPDHLYHLILFYWDIKAAIENLPDSPLWNLLWTLDFYIEKANLSEQQLVIVNCKKLRLPNKDIAWHLEKELGINHQENYISTIWGKIIQQIAAAVELNYDEWICKDYDKCWKKCNKCGQELLRDPRNFVRKIKAADGLTGRCKVCDKKLRQR